jgi:hypothetical protein
VRKSRLAHNLQELKTQVFLEMLDLAGRVFVLVRHSDNVVIGKRGFLPEEKEKGLVLVFNKEMNFQWEQTGISARLVFGDTPEHCFIPNDDILSVFSPELFAHFTVSPDERHKSETTLSRAAQPQRKRCAEKVVQVDFKRKK